LKNRAPKQKQQQLEAAGGIEPPYGALQERFWVL